MGLFKKFKDKLGTGGVKTEILAAPESISAEEPSAEIEISVMSEQDQEIKNIYVELQLQREYNNNNSGVTFGSTDNFDSSTQTRTETFSIVRVDMGRYAVATEEVKKFAVTLPLDALARSLQAQRTELGDGKVVNIIEKLADASRDYHDQYFFVAVVEIEGVRNPKDRRRVNVVGAGHQGLGGFKII